MSGMLMSNTVCAQAEAKIEASIPPAQRENYFKVVTAGMKVALNKGPQGLMAKLHDSQDPVSDVVNGAIGIIGVLRRQSTGTMPIGALVPATMTLILQGLDYLEKSKIMQITNVEVDKATHMFVDILTHKLGLTPQKLQGMLSQTQGAMADPNKLAQIKAGAQNGAA